MNIIIFQTNNFHIDSFLYVYFTAEKYNTKKTWMKFLTNDEKNRKEKKLCDAIYLSSKWICPSCLFIVCLHSMLSTSFIREEEVSKGLTKVQAFKNKNRLLRTTTYTTKRRGKYITKAVYWKTKTKFSARHSTTLFSP